MSNDQNTFIAEAALQNLRMAQGAMSDARSALDMDDQNPALAGLRAAVRDAQLAVLLAIRTSEGMVKPPDDEDDGQTRPMRPVGMEI